MNAYTPAAMPLRLHGGCVPAQAENRRWYCVRTEYRKEYEASREIAFAGFFGYLPQHVVYTPKHPPRIMVMFPKYMFVEFDIEQSQWRRIFSLRGVESMLCHAPECPTPIPAGQIDFLMSRGRSLDGVIDERAAPPALDGQTVELLDGPFANLSGLCSKSDAERVTVLLSMFGGLRPVVVGRSAVRVVV